MKKSKSAGKGGKFQKELQELKQVLITGDDFMKMYDFYFDLFGLNTEFKRSCKKAKHPRLKRLIAMIGEQMYKREVTITRFNLMKLRNSHFYHGKVFLEKSIGDLFFFEDIDMGVLAVVGDLPQTFFIRFSTLDGDPDDPDDPVMVTPIRSDSIH